MTALQGNYLPVKGTARSITTVLPEETLHRCITFLDKESDLKNATATCKLLARIATPTLYRSFSPNASGNNETRTLAYLKSMIEYPERAKYLKELQLPRIELDVVRVRPTAQALPMLKALQPLQHPLTPEISCSIVKGAVGALHALLIVLASDLQVLTLDTGSDLPGVDNLQSITPSDIAFISNEQLLMQLLGTTTLPGSKMSNTFSSLHTLTLGLGVEKPSSHFSVRILDQVLQLPSLRKLEASYCAAGNSSAAIRTCRKASSNVTSLTIKHGRLDADTVVHLINSCRQLCRLSINIVAFSSRHWNATIDQDANERRHALIEALSRHEASLCEMVIRDQSASLFALPSGSAPRMSFAKYGKLWSLLLEERALRDVNTVSGLEQMLPAQLKCLMLRARHDCDAVKLATCVVKAVVKMPNLECVVLDMAPEAAHMEVFETVFEQLQFAKLKPGLEGWAVCHKSKGWTDRFGHLCF